MSLFGMGWTGSSGLAVDVAMIFMIICERAMPVVFVDQPSPDGQMPFVELTMCKELRRSMST